MIIGTAGHIDHGKTTLVRALTGVDTDRLPEEKRRGITIELGFAPLVLDGIGTLGVVDVPGHEAFVRTMVAGATGIDLALVVVAADEGVMPQTREHLAILELLGVRHGVVALTKADLVDDDWLELVEDDVRGAVARSLPDAPIIATSAETGRGIIELRAAIAELARAVVPASRHDLFRLPVDRSFTIKGTGTVVTGTVWSGELHRDEVVRILPGDRSARVRGIQGHGAALDAAAPGGRSAVALAGVEVGDVPRGATLVTDRHWRPTTLARAEVSLVPGVEMEIRPRTWYRFHVGTSEVGARVVGRASERGGPLAARLILDEPVVLRAGDRFVLRTSAPLNTVAGGIVVDPYAPKRARPWPVGLDAPSRLALLVEESGAAGVETASLPVRLGVSPTICRQLVSESPVATPVGGRVIARSLLDELQRLVVETVTAYHAANPLDSGAPMQSIRAGLTAPPEVADWVIARALGAGTVRAISGLIALAGWSPKPTAEHERLASAVADRLDSAGSEPPSVEELSVALGADILPILRYMERQGGVVQVEDNRYYSETHLKQLIERLRGIMAGAGEVGPSVLRDSLGLSRKYLIPFLEYCDRVGYTNRNANGRVWRGT